MKHLKSINELFDFLKRKPKLKIGDELLCIKDFGFHLMWKTLPRTSLFEKGKKYKVSYLDDSGGYTGVGIMSDLPPWHEESGDKKQEQIFATDKKWSNNYFPILSDYFQLPNK